MGFNDLMEFLSGTTSTDRRATIINQLYKDGVITEQFSQGEISKLLDIGMNAVRETEKTAIRKLKHPSNMNILRDVLDSVEALTYERRLDYNDAI